MLNKFKSHLRFYSKRERNGIFLLLFLILLFLFIRFFWKLSPPSHDSIDVHVLQKEIDSIKKIILKPKKRKIYPFNPNFITDYKGFTLGMSVEEIDRLHAFRKQNKWINSVKEFQKVTKVPDSLLVKISPLFKFPDWLTKQSKSLPKQKYSYKKYKTTHEVSTYDINKATKEDFKSIKGIGDAISARIIKYRKKLQGYSLNSQLYEVWGVEKELMDDLLIKFKIVAKPNIKRINVNTANFKEVLRTPYVDYDLCKKIFNYRDEVAELQDIKELLNIEGLTEEKYVRISLYLKAE